MKNKSLFQINTMNKSHVLFLLFALVFFGACKKDEEELETPPEVNEEELITTLLLELSDGTDTFNASFRDLDGPGGDDPVIVSDLELNENTQYTATIQVLNEADGEFEDITLEVEEEGDEHLFCFGFEGISDIDVAYADSDGIYGIGIESNWSTATSGSGNVTITLKHQPGVKDGTCDPGDTDIEVSFPISVN